MAASPRGPRRAAASPSRPTTRSSGLGLEPADDVEQERAGTASGINNAVARVAGVLAVAVLGAVMAAAFAHSLRHSLDGLDLNAGVVHQLESNVAKLGSLDEDALDSQRLQSLGDFRARFGI